MRSRKTSVRWGPTQYQERTAITLSRDEVHLLVDAFLFGYASEWQPDETNKRNAWGSAAVSLRSALRSRKFPVTLVFRDEEVEALQDVVNSMNASGGGAEDAFSDEFGREPRLRKVWSGLRALDRIR
jgi:hypothetical protein